MKCSKAHIQCKTRQIHVLKFEDQSLTSFSGLIVFQSLFDRLGLKERLRQCFRHLKVGSIYGHHRIVLLLVIHLLLGYRELRDVRYYRDDPIVKRVIGLKRLPDVATVSRVLASADARSVDSLRALIRGLVLSRLDALRLTRLTLDFDGSVQSTTRFAEGPAVGFNKKKKGQRSYYPLICTIAQIAMVFDILHRPGNVHDSNGAKTFILQCINTLRAALPGVKIEVRMDSAFFSEATVESLDEAGIDFTLSVPFARFGELKALIEGRCRWRRFNRQWTYFESPWRPKRWHKRYRFCFIRARNKKQHKAPVQLDLFVPYEYGYDFTVIVTNKALSVKKVLAYHHGRGAQEGLFAELKSQAQMDYIPTRTLPGNQLYLLAGILAHNLNRELQMQAKPKDRHTSEKRSALWEFLQLDTIRRTLLQRAGRITRPEGRLTLTMSANATVRKEMLHYLGVLDNAA